jgi:mRNA interferase MazF
MKPGDIVLIRYPQTDLQAGKLRPALVVAIAPGRYPDLLLAYITSRVHQAVPEFDEIIEPTDADYLTTGLKARSVVRLARLAVVDPAIINAKLGYIAPERLQVIKHRLANWLLAQN